MRKLSAFAQCQHLFSGLLAIGLLLAWPALSLAAPGELDPTFGSGGKVVTDISGAEYAGDLVLQPDGKIIVAGTINPTIDIVDFVLVRYNRDGSLDVSFGSGGKVFTEFGGSDGAGAVALQPDGKIVVAGGSQNNFALARYNPDGSLDSTFGSGGKVTTDFSGLPDSANAITIQPDGKIIAAGIVDVKYVGGNLLDPKTDADFGLVRYNTDGSLDTTFGDGGKVSTEFNGRYDYIDALALQADGKIVAAGFAATPAGSSNWNLFDNGLARYNPDGSLDSTFGSGGKVVTDWKFSGDNGINALVLQADGKLFTAGYACHYDACYTAMARYNADGTLFSQDIPFSLGLFFTDLALQADGKIVAAGGSGWDFGLARYNADGTLDTSFGTLGKITTDFGGWDYVNGVVIQPNGKIVAVGNTYNQNSTNSDIALARYLGDAPASSCANQIDCSGFFVCQHYLDFLNRQPDASGLAFWTNEIDLCGADPLCLEVKRVNVSAAYFLSIEFRQTGYLVYRIYKASYGNLPGLPIPIRLSEFLPDTQQIGQGVIVNQTGWQQVLENNTQTFASAFVQRSRFTSAFPTSMTPTEFVDKLFANAGLTPSGTDYLEALNEFGWAATTADVNARARVLRRVAENSTFASQEFNRAFVLMEYFGYLRRNPNDAPDGNFDGYDFWLSKLNQFNGNYIEAEMVKAFITSSEYRQRFGQP